MSRTSIESDFLDYVVEQGCEPGVRLPPLNQISAELGVSVGKLREQLEVARVLGLVDPRPRRGIECNEYSFLPAVRTSMMVALSLDPRYFRQFSALRSQLESAFWHEAVSRLTPEDTDHLLHLVRVAWSKLQQERIQIPHGEHRAFHLAVFRRLDNVFVSGLLEAYWDAYEAVDLNTYADYSYLTAVWHYHERIALAIAGGEVDEAKRLHEAHMQLLTTRGVTLPADAPVHAPGDAERSGNGRAASIE